ncbi:Rieske (2Fe-2S) protein [Corynebacterium tuberculostearicum]|uniref:Rieske (2Fe-2S) protein n=1 Tax=Corynebacterium tuberculostearicum TaxID=38304 RepID=UPI002649BB8A|nr:Rieske 2Fe-2S domain-containing protein [Corynebacterium tuberculostearicum]WKE60548.1 Rieske 2Fe-2S domain-containing protein [Corynebacterium tuberculostearicum]
MTMCSRRMFLLGTATTFAGVYAAACGSTPSAEIAATDIPIGSAKIVDGVIFTQPEEGEFKAYSQTCPHQRNPITEIEGMTATCTAHNTSYDLSDGSVISGPGRDPLEEYEVRQDGSNVTTT